MQAISMQARRTCAGLRVSSIWCRALVQHVHAKTHANILKSTRTNMHDHQAFCECVHAQGDVVAATKRATGQGGARRSMGGTNYNILTLDYANTPGGEALRYQVWEIACKG